MTPETKTVVLLGACAVGKERQRVRRSEEVHPDEIPVQRGGLVTSRFVRRV